MTNRSVTTLFLIQSLDGKISTGDRTEQRTLQIMGGIDKRNRFDEEVFSYRATKDGKVFLFWHRKHIKIVKGRAAQEFLEDIADANHKEAQLIMAKITGHFKHGNEH